MFALKLKEEPGAAQNPNNEADFERDHIKSLITSLDSEDDSPASYSLNTQSSSNKALCFSFDFNEPKVEKAVPQPQLQQPSDSGGNKSLLSFSQPEPQVQQDSTPTLRFDQLNTGNSKSDNSIDVLSQLKAFADEVHSSGDYNSFSETDINALSYNDDSPKQEGSEAPFVAYVQNLQNSRREVDEKEFLTGKANSVAMAKAISGLVYINQLAAEHIYSLAVIEIYNGQFDFAKAGLLFICDASTDQKYVGMALDLLQSNALCSKEEFISIVKDVISKEEILKNKVTQL